MWHTIFLLLINHGREQPHSTKPLPPTPPQAMNSQKMKIIFEEGIWGKRGELWSEGPHCSLREGSRRDKRYQIDEGDEEAGRRRRDMIPFLWPLLLPPTLRLITEEKFLTLEEKIQKEESILEGLVENLFTFFFFLGCLENSCQWPA